MKKWALHPYRSRTSATYWRALIPPSSNVSMNGDPAGRGNTSRTVRGRQATAAWRAAMWPSNSSQSSLYLPACGPGKPLASDSPFFTTSWYSKDTALITCSLSPCSSRAGARSTVQALDQGRQVFAELDRIDAGREPIDLEGQDGRRESLRESGKRPVRPATREVDVGQGGHLAKIHIDLADHDDGPFRMPDRHVLDDIEIDPLVNGAPEPDDGPGEVGQLGGERRVDMSGAAEMLAVHAVRHEVRPLVRRTLVLVQFFGGG